MVLNQYSDSAAWTIIIRQVWHACGAKNTRKLEKLQERALRFVYLDKFSSYDDLLTKANLATLDIGRLKMLATEV